MHETRLIELTKGRRGQVAGALIIGRDDALLEVRADLVIGADGRNSTIARTVGAETLVLAEHHSSTVYGHFDGLEADGYHWMYRPGASIGRIPTNGGACVFASVPRQAYKRTFGDDALRGFLHVIARFDNRFAAQLLCKAAETRLCRFPGAHGFMRQAHGRGWALVGDAGYFKDPLTAHGITDAFRDAELLSRAVLDGGENALASFQEERDALSTPLFEATDTIASFDWTMDELKAHHRGLNKAMRTELEHLTLGWRGNVLAA